MVGRYGASRRCQSACVDSSGADFNVQQFDLIVARSTLFILTAVVLYVYIAGVCICPEAPDLRRFETSYVHTYSGSAYSLYV